MSNQELSSIAKKCLEKGNICPFDVNESDDQLNPPIDWAHAAARGIFYDLGDRAGISNEMDDIDNDVRIEMVEMAAEIIRQAIKINSESV